MLGRVRQIGGYRSGEYDVLSGVTAYNGGQPMYMGTGGTLEVATQALDTGTTLGYVGVVMNSKAYDQEIGYDYSRSGTGTGMTTVSRYKCGTIRGPAQLTLQSGTKGNNAVADGFPYETGVTWTAGDDLYIGASGLWTNTGLSMADVYGDAASSGTPTSGRTLNPVRGHVNKVGTNDLEVEIY